MQISDCVSRNYKTKQAQTYIHTCTHTVVIKKVGRVSDLEKDERGGGLQQFV